MVKRLFEYNTIINYMIQILTVEMTHDKSHFTFGYVLMISSIGGVLRALFMHSCDATFTTLLLQNQEL